MKIPTSIVLDLKKLVVVTIVFLYSCTPHTQRSGAEISGIVEGASGQKLYLEKVGLFTNTIIDSTAIDEEGRFRFTFPVEESGYYIVRQDDGKFVTLVVHPHDHLTLQSVAASFDDHYSIEGNEDSEILRRYFSVTRRTKAAFDSLREVFFQSVHLENFPEIKTGIDSSLHDLIEKQRIFAKNLVTENPSSFAVILIISQSFEGVRLFDPVKDLFLLTRIDSTLSAQYPGNSHVVDFHMRVNQWKAQQVRNEEIRQRFSAGKPFPDLSLPDPDGNNHRISDLKGKVVLVYLWASWSPPCRAINHQLKHVYSTISSKGFEIYGVALDHQKRYWLNAIQIDELPWINVSDLKGSASPMIDLFGISGDLPFFVLIDPQGNIIISGNRFQIIRDKLSEYFGTELNPLPF